MSSQGFHPFSPTGILFSVGVFAFLSALYAIGNAIYNVWLHPLSHIPGPMTACCSGIPYNYHVRNGTLVKWIHQLHEKYGEAVRVNPYEVSFISGETAWQDIYGFRTGKHRTPPYLKDRNWFPLPVNKTWSIIAADEEAHSRMRRNLSHAFSEKALKEQEGLIQALIDLLIQRLNEEVEEGKPSVDIMRWYNYTTFDIITDLTFGEPLYCLRDKGYHRWVNMVFASAESIGILAARRRYPLIAYYDRVKELFKQSDKSAILRRRQQFFEVTSLKVQLRLDSEEQRPDFMSHVIKSQAVEAKALSKDEINSNAILFLIAGSETTATLLSGATYLMLKNPEVYAKAVHEIRTRFKSYDEITINEVSKCEYMIAIFQEGLRYYPPVPTGFPRVVPPGGDNISGRYIPAGMSVYVSQHASNHSSRNWVDPDAFVPERWLGDERYKDDNRATLNPFSFGPRNCLGKNLAYAEMRLILAKVLFSFDIDLVDKSEDWIGIQKVKTLWAKEPLMVKLRPVHR